MEGKHEDVIFTQDESIDLIQQMCGNYFQCFAVIGYTKSGEAFHIIRSDSDLHNAALSSSIAVAMTEIDVDNSYIAQTFDAINDDQASGFEEEQE